MGHDVAQAPEYFTARVLKTSPMKALTGKGRLSKGFLVEFKSGHVGMVQRIVGTGRFHYTVRSGAPSTSDKMQTMGSPSAAAMPLDHLAGSGAGGGAVPGGKADRAGRAGLSTGKEKGVRI